MPTKYIALPSSRASSSAPIIIPVRVLGTEKQEKRGRDLVTVEPVKGLGTIRTFKERLFDTAEEALASVKVKP